MVIIPHRKDMDIRNVENAGKIKNARYLEVIDSHEPGAYIACRWLRKEPKAKLFPGSMLIDFEPQGK